MDSEFPEFEQVVSAALAVGAVLDIKRSPSYCSAVMAEGPFKVYALVASSRIDGKGPELCDPNEFMLARLGLRPEDFDACT